MLKLNSFFKVLLLLLLTVSCSQIQKNAKYPKWNYPPDNPFPSIFTIRKYQDQNIGLVAKLNSKTIKMSCRLRNDSPYYWCDFEGELTSPDPKLPKKIGSTFHRVVDETGAKTALNFAKRMKNNNEPVIIVLQTRLSIEEIDNSIYSLLLGAYNSKECFDVFEDYSLCPKTAKKLDIFSGKYIEE